MKLYNTDKEFKNLFLKRNPVVERYIENLHTYDQWDPANRQLIFYEDLVTNPLEQVKKILAFFDEPIPDSLTEEFSQSITRAALAAYDQEFTSTGGSHSKGTNLEYHSKQVPKKYLLEIDAAMERFYPRYWELYLMRYATKSL